jgi:hypothetical protein
VHLGTFVLAMVAAAPSGRAPLRLQFERCPEIDQAMVGQVVVTELSASLAEESRGGAVTTATAQCTDGQVLLTVDDPVTGKSSARTVDLAGQPRGLRSRLLGLAISEAVLASWIELQLRREPPAAPLPDAVSADDRDEAAAIAVQRLQVRPAGAALTPRQFAVGPTVRWFSSGLLTVGLAAGARHWFDRYRLAGLGLEVEASYGRHDVPGVAHADAGSLALAPGLSVRSDFDSFAVMASTGLRLGLARLSAEPVASSRSAHAAFRGFAGPFLAMEVTVPLLRAWFLRGSVETGYALLPARGRLDSTAVVGIEGSWLGGALALGGKL